MDTRILEHYSCEKYFGFFVEGWSSVVLVERQLLELNIIEKSFSIIIGVIVGISLG